MNNNEAENKNGIFGPIYNQFCAQPKQAIKHLLKMQNGECPKALNNREKIFLLTAFDLRKKPVKVKMVKENGVWKITDFIRDGVSELHEMQDYIAADATL